MQNKQAFTMIELIIVIVIIGILSAVAIPKFAANRDTAVIAKGQSTLAAVRSAIATEKQKRMLSGIFDEITDLANNGAPGGKSGEIFSFFSKYNIKNSVGNTVVVAHRVLEYPLKSGYRNGQWSKSSDIYTFHYFAGKCDFKLKNNRLDPITECSVFSN